MPSSGEKAGKSSNAQPPYPLKVGHYLVSFGENKMCSFSKISGLVRKKLDYMPYLEGGQNDYVHILTKPSDKYNTAVFEKGAGLCTFDFVIGSSPDVMIFLRDEQSRITKVFVLDETKIMSVEYSDLDALSSGVMLERVSVLYRGMREMKVK